MAEGMFSHLIRVAYETIGGQKVIAEAQQVDKSLTAVGKGAGFGNVNLEMDRLAAKTKAAADEAEKLNKKSNKGGLDIMAMVKRAAMVAPVWMVIRGIIQSTTEFVKEGIKYWLDTEEATNKLGASLREIGATGTKSISGITDAMRNLSVETGKALPELIGVFATVNRILLDTSTAQAAVAAANKYSIMTGADVMETAKTMAILYKTQGDSLKGLTTDTQKFNEILTIMYATQSKNGFGGPNQLNSDLLSTNPILALLDLGLENSIRLMGEFEAVGTTTGTTLQTGLMKIIANMEVYSKKLNITLPETATTAEKFLAVMNKLSTMKQDNSFFELLREIFGAGGRGGIKTASLIQGIEGVNAALKGTGASARETYLAQKQYSDVIGGTDEQLKIFDNLKKQIGTAMIEGITGGQKFGVTMKALNTTIKGTSSDISNVVSVINNMNKLGISSNLINFGKLIGDPKDFNNIIDLQKKITLAMQGEMTVNEINNLIEEVKTTSLIEQEDIRQRNLLSLNKEKSLLEANTKLQEKAATIEAKTKTKTDVAILESKYRLEKLMDDLSIGQNATMQQQILARMKYVEQDISIIDNQKRINELAGLQNDLIKDKLTMREKELGLLGNLAMQYDNASNYEERSRITRAAEISQMKPEDVSSLYNTGSNSTRQIIRDFLSSFTNEIQLAVTRGTPFYDKYSSRVPELTAAEKTNKYISSEGIIPPPVAASITGVGVMNITIDGKQLTQEEMGLAVGNEVAKNPELAKKLAATIGKIV